MHRFNRRRVRVVALCAIVAMGLAACGDDDDTEETTSETTAVTTLQGSPSVSVDMIDFGYTVSGPLTAGGTLNVANSGKEFHLLAMGKLKPGKTLADLQTALSQAGPPGGGGPEGETTTSTGGTTATTSRTGATTTTAAAGAGGPEGEGGGEDEDPTAEILEEVGWPGNFMSPGESAEVTASNLTVGTYAFICFIPSEGGGPPHFAKGMVGQMEVVPGSAPPAPTADATYKVAPGKAVEGPTTLSPGRHVLKIEAAAGSEQLEPTLARLNQGTTYQQLDQSFATLFEGEEGPPPGAASRTPGQVVFGGFDLQGVTTSYLTVDLKPGNYILVAEDTDPEERPRPPREIINIRVA